MVKANINLAIIVEKKQLEKYLTRPKTNQEYFNYEKKSHYFRDYYTFNKKKLKNYSKKLDALGRRKIKSKLLLLG